MRRRCQRRFGVARQQQVGSQTIKICLDCLHAQAGAAGTASHLVGARLLDGEQPGPVFDQRLASHIHRLDGSLADDDLLVAGDESARAPEEVGERRSKLALSARIAVVEGAQGGRLHGVEQGALPSSAGQQRQVGAEHGEIDAELRPARRPGGGNRSDGGNPRHGTSLRDQIALGDEMSVGSRDHAPGDSQLSRERTRCWETAPLLQRAPQNCGRDLCRELVRQRHPLAAIECD